MNDNMPSENVCRLCLAIDAPMSIIAHCQLQYIYEKLTNSPLITSNKPVVACYICKSQLKKCYRLMTQTIRADKLLTAILKSGKLVNSETIRMIDRKQFKLKNSLCITPVEIAEFLVPGRHIQKEIKKEPMSYDEVEIKTEWANENVKHENEGYVIQELGVSCNIINEGLVYNDDMGYELNGYIIEDSINIEDSKNEKLVAMAGIETEDTPLDKLQRIHTEPQATTLISNQNNREETSTSDIEKSARKVRKTKKKKQYIESSISSYSDNDSKDIDFDINIEQNSKDNSFECNTCHRKYNTREKLLQHSRLHSKRYECSKCHKKFGIKCNLDRHLRMHTKEKLFKCKICDRDYYTKYHLDQHSITHTGQKPFECEICKLRFNRKNNLKTHMNEHSEEKPFKCNICQKCFKRKGNLKEHIRAHTGEKPYKCDLCHIRFTYKYSLKKHTCKSIHDDYAE